MAVSTLTYTMSRDGESVIVNVGGKKATLNWKQAKHSGRTLRTMGNQAERAYKQRHPAPEKLQAQEPLSNDNPSCGFCGADFLTDHYDGCTMSSRTRSI